MKKKEIVDLVVAVVLVVLGSMLLTLPLLQVTNVKYIFMGVLTFYGVTNLTQFLATSEDKDYE
jgi:ascorbate-specific PTS system EIIC-type component UlaA